MLLLATFESLKATLPSLIQGAGLSAFFASRTFIPAFATALTLRFGLSPEWFGWFGVEVSTAQEPTWFTGTTCLVVLALLSAVEVVATKSADARAVMVGIDPYVRPVVAVLTYMGLSGAVFPVEEVVGLRTAGFLDLFPALLVGVATWWTTTTRSDAVAFLADADEDDDLGVQDLMSWAEDLWAAAGPWLLVIFGGSMLLVAGIVIGLFYLLKKRAEYKDEQSKIECKACTAKVYGSAVQCQSCGTKIDAPRAIGFFGGAKKGPAHDLARHPFLLAEKKRCSTCATRLEERRPRQTCTACGHELFADSEFAQAYLDSIASRLPRTLAVSALFSLVPIVGLIPGVIYYRFAIVAPFRRYTPRGRSLFLRWGITLFFILLALVQLVPVVGGAVVPLMAFVNYRVYRTSFQGLLDEAPPPPAERAVA